MRTRMLLTIGGLAMVFACLALIGMVGTAARDTAARALAEAPLGGWPGWIAYFLEELELADDGTAVATGDYDDMLNEISATIAHRIARGGW